MGKDSMRVAHIVGKWVGGGVEAVILNYYRKIDKNEIQFDFIIDEDSNDIPYDEIKKYGGNVILIPPYQKVFKYHKALKRVLKEGNYRIVHSHINVLSVFSLYAAKKANIPVRIAHSHSTTNKVEWKKNLLKQFLRPFNKLFATNYMCCSEQAGRWLFGNAEYEKGNVYLLKNAIELENFKYNPEIRRKLKNEFNIDDETIVIGHIGRFVKQKNHEFIIDIFNEINKKCKNYKLMLVGQGPDKFEIEKKVKEMNLDDKVIFLGQRNDVNEIYQLFDIFLFPSLYEGLGIVLIEAQAAGCNSFASTEVPEIVNVTGNIKFVSLNQNVSIWADEILKVSNIRVLDDDEKIKKSGYDINDECKKLELLYKKLLKDEEKK